MANPTSFLQPRDIAVYTDFFRVLAVPQLIDRTLQRLYEHGPTRARDALEIFLDAATQSQEWYYRLVVTLFEQAAHRIEHQGFTGDLQSKALRFSVPLNNGDIFELFPYGASLEVTPSNYDCFVRLWSLYRQLNVRQNNANVYIQQAHFSLPTSPQANLLNCNYRVILLLLKEHLLNPGSPWHIKDEAVWHRLGMTYAVPFQRRIFALSEAHDMNDPVPLRAAIQYVTSALERLHQMEETAKSSGSLLNDVAPRVTKPTSPPETVCTVRSPAMTDPERNFWAYVQLLVEQPNLIPANKFSFQIRLPGGTINLKENGEYIAVTDQNVRLFGNLLESRRDEVHRLFEPAPGDTPLAPAPPPATLSPNTTSAHSCVSLTTADLDDSFFPFARRLRNRFEAGNLSDEQLEELKIGYYIPSKSGIYELIPDGKQIHVNAQNAADFFSRVESERSRLEAMGQQQQPPMAIPHPGINPSIPLSSSYSDQNCNEHNLAVNQPPLSSFQTGVAPGHVPKPPQSPPPATASAMTTSQWRTFLSTNAPQTSRGDFQALLYAGSDAPVALNTAAAGAASTATGTILDEEDLPFLREFEYHTSTVAKSVDPLTDPFFEWLDFKWAILIPGRDVLIPLREGGELILVTKEDLAGYFEAVVEKIREIRGSIEQRGHYIVPNKPPHSMNGSVAVARLPPTADARETLEMQRSALMRQTAVPITPSPAEVALFSPTHNEGGLFSPAQHINL